MGWLVLPPIGHAARPCPASVTITTRMNCTNDAVAEALAPDSLRIAGCIGLAILSGVWSVAAVLVVTYPQSRAGDKGVSACAGSVHAFLSVLFTLLAAVCALAASWFGPVSMSYPISVCSTLMLNILMMGGMKVRAFSKGQRVGTYVITFAVLALPEVGVRACNPGVSLRPSLDVPLL